MCGLYGVGSRVQGLMVYLAVLGFRLEGLAPGFGVAWGLQFLVSLRVQGFKTLAARCVILRSGQGHGVMPQPVCDGYSG